MKGWAWFVVAVGTLVFATAPMMENQYFVMGMGGAIILIGVLFLVIKRKKK